jgi:hypothetical protein
VKVGRILIFGAGYVLGTKAGRERYEQLLQLARRATERLEEYNRNSGLDAESWSEPDTAMFYDQGRR